MATNFCTNCGTALTDEQAFCPACGTPRQKKNLCANCGTELQENQAFCPTCGYRAGAVVDTSANTAISQFNAELQQQQQKNKKKPIVIAAILAAIVVVGAIVGTVVQQKKAEEAERQRQAAIAEYKSNAAEFYASVLSSGGTMEDIGNEIQTSWTAYVKSSRYNGVRYYSVDTAVAAALVYMSSEVNAVKNSKSQIESLYRRLTNNPDPGNYELEQIRDAVKEAYSAYLAMYDCVIDPAGNYNTWTAAFSDTDTDLANAIRELKALVG